MALMIVLGAMLLGGVALTLWWGSTEYRPWAPTSAGDPSVGTVTRRYLRGTGVALVGGFWAGALVTGPAVRLIMRLLAVTAGDDAQGRITEADEVVGAIELDGTIGLYLFGGVLPGLLSGAIYVVLRTWLPRGRLGGLVFGALHLVVAATRIDPLRPDNPDFDIVGPGWLSVATFALAALLHGMAVAAIANRFSTWLPPTGSGAAARAKAVLPLVLPVLLLIPAVFLLVPLVIGLLVTVAASQIAPVVRAAHSRGVLVGGRIVLAALALLLLPGAITDLGDIVSRS